MPHLDQTAVNSFLQDAERKGASEEQIEAVRDGTTTFAEYEAGALAAMDCLDELGIEAHLELLPGQMYDIEFIVPDGPGGPEDPETLERLDQGHACLDAHFHIVQDAWIYQRMPTEEEIQEARAALATCIRDAGVEVPEPATSQDIDRIRQTGAPAYFDCVDQIQEEFPELPGFAG